MTRVSLSWLDLKPNRDIYGNQEIYEEYIQRIRETYDDYSHIPDEVFKQWLWAHHNNCETLKNYGWINYQGVEFVLNSWTSKQLSEINVISEYSDYVSGRASFKNINDFCCNVDDLNSWKQKGTWQTPPVILDVSSIDEEIPIWSEIKHPFQLIEGHSRFGYLKSMINLQKVGKAKLASTHLVYEMKIIEKDKSNISCNRTNLSITNDVSVSPEEMKRILDEIEI